MDESRFRFDRKDGNRCLEESIMSVSSVANVDDDSISFSVKLTDVSKRSSSDIRSVEIFRKRFAR